VESDAPSARRHIVRTVVTNPALVIGTLAVLALLGLVLFGGRLTQADPTEIHGAMIIEGEIGAPPFRPSTVFPWGSDHIGRDVQALVLSGARQTLTLALAGMLARVLLGTVVGMLAGWWRGGWLDRLISGLVAVWAAFPVTLFAMLLILALGIQQGKSVFIVALCVVGWGEIAQANLPLFRRAGVGSAPGEHPRLVAELPLDGLVSGRGLLHGHPHLQPVGRRAAPLFGRGQDQLQPAA